MLIVASTTKTTGRAGIRQNSASTFASAVYLLVERRRLCEQLEALARAKHVQGPYTLSATKERVRAFSTTGAAAGQTKTIVTSP